MDRRSAIKRLSILGGGILLAPSCQFSQERVSVALDNLNITASQEKLLAEITETIIPATEIPGAKSLGVHHFVLVMIDDCRDENDQKLFLEGLGKIDQLADRFYKTSFTDSSSTQREELLSGVLEEKEDFKSQLGPDFDRFRQFLHLVKRYTVQGFMESQYVMTEIFPYVMAPGYFNGCVPVEQEG